MKVKTFILSLLLTMFCSTSFGQHWGEIPNDYDDSMTFVTQIFIDGELQGEGIEIGAFCGNEFRGSARPITSQANLVYLLIGGDADHNGDQISFRLAQHYADGTSEELDYVVLNAVQYDNGARIGGSPADLVNGLLPEDDRTEFNSVAELNGKVYPSLANALAACTTGDNTIELLKDNAENVIIKQVEGVNVTIDGGTSRFDYSGTITIHGNARYQGTETLTFTNIDFTTDKAGHYFIDSNSTGSVERHAHNVTVDDCNFTATGAGVNSAAAMRIRQGFDIAINGGTFTYLHSVLQAYGNAGINITGITSNCKNGISVGSSTGVVITDSEITATGATGYGVRAGENVTGPITITDTKINAFIPVSVRKVTDDTNCEFTFTGNTMNASNTDGYWCVIGTSEYEANGSLPETAGKIIVNATEDDLLGVYGYSRVEVTFADNTTKYFYMMEDAVPYNNADNYEGATIKLLSNCAGRGLRFWENGMTFDLNGKKYTINQAVGSSGTESQGFQIRPEVTGNVTIKNGTIDIKAGTNVKWMFNSYAADFVVENVTIDGTNMVTTTDEDYLLVVQNAGDKATFNNVTINNYTAKKVYLEGNTTFVAPQEFDNIEIPAGYVLVYENGAYIVKAGNVLNETTSKKYATLAEAIAAATAGDKLVLLADINENVTVNKSVTIDGANAEGGKFDYTGKMTANAGLTVTVQNIDFVGGGFDKSTKSTTGNYTIKNCTFEDDGDYAYPVRFKGASSVTIEDCTVKNYLYSFLYITSGTNSVSVKNVTVEDCPNYAVYFASGVNSAIIENLTVKNSDNGFVINNTANRALTLINCKLENVLNAINHSNGTNTITCTLLGNENNFGTSASSQYAKYVLAEADATLTAPEGLNVTTSVAEYVVVYENAKYQLKPAVASITADGTTTYYETLAGAVEAATAGQTVNLLADATGAGLKINKDVTINFGDFTYTINQAVGSTGTESQGFQLLKNNTVTLKNGTIAIAENTNVKWMFNAYANVTLENLNVNCANMAAPAENEANYVLVVNNGGGATPTVTYTNVIVTNFPSTATAQIWLDPRTTLKAGAGLENSIETEEGYVVVYNNGEYTAIGAVAKIGEAIYPSVAAAVAAAEAGDVIELLVNVTEDVTVNKSVTIDGANAEGGKFDYTGKMTANAGLTVTVQNIDFVGGGFDKSTKSTTGNYTIKNCTFEDDGDYAYPLKFRGANKIIVENCTVKNYLYSFLYITSGTNSVSVKNVTVEDCPNYAVYFASGVNSAIIENLTVKNSNNGFVINNTANRALTLKNCKLENVNNAINHSNGTNTITCNLLGNENNFGTSASSQYAKYVLVATDATLTAPEGLDVTTSVAGYVVDYADGKYYLRVPNYVAAIGETKYESLQAAIDEAVDNDVIVVIDNIEVTIDDLAGLQLVGSNYPSYYVVRGKTISIDLNGMMIKANVSATDMLLGLFSTEQSGNLTLKDSSNGNGKVEIVATNDADVYSLITNYDSSSAITIDGGNYILNKVGDSGQSLIYDSPGNMVVNGGNFYLGNLGQGVGDVNENGIPWIFNVRGQNDGHVTVNGGTFNADVNHQHWAYEVNVPNTLALKDNGNGTWTVVDAVAQGTDSWRGYNRSLGYASIADAAYWATAETTVTVVADHAITVPAVVESNITLDMNAKAVTAQDIYPVIRIQNGASLTVTGVGSITNNDYVFVLGASDGSSAGNLTIESGTFHGTTTVASVTKGNLNITGGEFSVEPYQGNYAFLINCIDANYNNGDATVSISGGTFHNWNPENNAAEGANTNFCAQGYGAVENPTDVWTVVPKLTAEVKDGWNWFSYYVEGNVLDQLQNSLGAAGVQIKSRTAFTQYSNGNWNGDLLSTTPAESYKINVDADAVINVTGNIVDPSTCYIMLNNGGTGNGAWNWIGYPLAQETSVATAFAGVVKNGDEVKTRTGFAEYVNGQWWGPLMTLEPGVGYMYFRAGANETVSNFTYPTPSSKEAVQPNITADANLWVPNSTSYANNMTMVAVLNMNGEMMNDNYEVAAMVNGEVRGSARPIYVEPMDAYMLFLTIHGEGVEEVTFQCYDFNTDTEYVLNNTINYSDDARLGSVNEPYVLCYGTMGIGENAMNTINIYPNPTTTGREINLGATCDKVEVYNALGVKVAEYQDVDTLDAIETAGIYVIRVTNDGDVKHCRLVVK